MRYDSAKDCFERGAGADDLDVADAIARGQNPEFVRLLSRLPSQIRESFTTEQLVFLAEASHAPEAKHMFKSKVSIPFFGKRSYLSFLFGRDLRNDERLKSEGQLGLKSTSLVYGVALWVIGSMLFVTGGFLLYLLTFIVVDNGFFDVPSFLQGVA